MLIDKLSVVRQKLVSSVPVKLGVRQYRQCTITYNALQYPFVAKITELTPGQKLNYLQLGVNVNVETKRIENIPFSVPEEAAHNGQYAYDGIIADAISVTQGTVAYTAIVQEYRDR